MKRRGILFGLFLVLLTIISTGAVANAKDFPIGSTLDDFKLTDISGKDQSLNGLKGKNGTVLVFLSAQCPVVKGYNERINKIAAAYQAKGINFVGINANATESLDWIKSNAAEVGYKFPVLIDKGNVLADKLGAESTPETYFFDEKNVLLYHGGIDDSRSGENISENYLSAAFDAKLSGKPIARTSSRIFGCSIKRAGN